MVPEVVTPVVAELEISVVVVLPTVVASVMAAASVTAAAVAGATLPVTGVLQTTLLVPTLVGGDLTVFQSDSKKLLGRSIILFSQEFFDPHTVFLSTFCFTENFFSFSFRDLSQFTLSLLL